MKLGVISLGCDKATVDSERLVGELVGHGARVVPGLETADVILVNTCGFIDAAKQESIEAILEAAALKRSAGVRAVVAVGCLVERYRSDLRQEIPEVDLFLGFHELHTLVPELAARGLIADPVADHPGVRAYLGDQPHVRYLKISEGCDHTCAFCAIPLMRGRHRSEPLTRLVREAQQLEAQGAKEINLVAQDLGHYGRDLGRGGPALPELLTALLADTAVPWFRLLYVYSAGLSDRLIDLMAREPRIVPYIDIPIQHASDALLERMRRPERRDTIRATVGRLRDAIPDIAIRTTAIVGFPGETDEDFRTLCAFAEEIQVERLGVFTYSEQEGTRAAVYPDDVPEALKRARQDELTELQRAISQDRLGRYVGRESEVLVDALTDPDEDGATHVGRVPWQADDVDGVTWLEQGGWARPGDLVRVRIDDNMDYDFRASAVV
ncbi:MAG: 30S ribosomal protein S12 methylthiotransferase RimO [Gemmatimonadota bacterium]|nr:30S ribosomal protein S12 methylthiotransferase RimO [Gemmatimonadota bacterium]MDH3366692.1 30S ribosomal protein S12 methylthiotransferase RimO [Gemmatimonadota bacterium]MDH3477367.1 30S ribosomal protein S12 methylthiotransferase RimO [Gemmatimonadota bacterium]MDH3569321.1 30S ribosomal protein S12 methylthiotransferase RimO [Gemmatimonadota bacterium]MDH5549124.1 30S ribosomal protein S12 methylthiotransferase RimO [Gemmatimonadota bacterium]